MVVLLILVALIGVNLTGGGKASASEQVQLESTSTSGPAPFGPPAGQDATGVVAPTTSTTEQPGNASGLYATEPGQPSCDKAALTSQLTSNPAKATAWAAPLGTTADGIPNFVQGLNAVTLRADTAVTEYGYSSGQFQPYPAVLQAGTAVLVNSYGEPTVKCYNADPLGKSTKSNTSGKNVGAAWAGYDAKRTITVAAAPAPQTSLVTINQTTNVQVPVVVNIDPNTPPKPNPTPPMTTGGKLVLTGVHNYDGTITLSDGRVIRKDGSVVKASVDVTHPPGSTTLADGGIRHPDGLVFNKDGTQRKGIQFAGPPARTVNPDGTTTPPLTFGFIKWNYDGSFLIIDAGRGGSVKVVDANGNLHPAVPPIPAGSTVNGDGSITTPDGKILNPDGAQRPPQQPLPGGTTLNPDGSNTPPADMAGDPAAVQINQKNLISPLDPNNTLVPDNGTQPSAGPDGSGQQSAEPSASPGTGDSGSGGTTGDTGGTDGGTGGSGSTDGGTGGSGTGGGGSGSGTGDSGTGN